MKTTCDQKQNKVLRTIFDKKEMYYQTITDYIPPLFLAVNYEEAAFTRSYLSTSSSDPYANYKTDELFYDNLGFVEALLIAADCNDSVMQHTFLRLETVGDNQRHFLKLYPLWSVQVGALVRLSFSSWLKRSRALTMLASNAASNQDVYTINYAANQCTVTVVDYLEPLFAYCMKMEKEDNNYIEQNSTNFAQTSSTGLNSSGKKASLAAAANTSEMFEINFCLIDEPVNMQDTMECEGHEQHKSQFNEQGSVVSCSSSVASTSSKRSTTVGKKRTAGTSTNLDNYTNPIKKRQKKSLILEKSRAIHGSLSIHDVRPYFSMLHARRLSRLSIDQLEELPLVVIRCERHFCTTTCSIINRIDNQLTTLHVYYCWEDSVHAFLSACADLWNRRQNTQTLVAVSDLCSEDIEARLAMLRDLKNVIWKDNMQAYIRLAIDNTHDGNMVSRNFHEPLVFRTQRNAPYLETEINQSVKYSMESGSVEMFQNSITLDCSRLCDDLDPKICGFAKAYHCLLADPSLTCNGSIRLDQQSITTQQQQHDTLRLLDHRQNIYGRLVSEFRSERILDMAFDMATELHLGLLDVFGMKYTERIPNNRHQRLNKPNSTLLPDNQVLDSLRVANSVFVETLTENSMYFGMSGSMSPCSGFFSKENKVKPIVQSTRGLYKGNMIEFDLKSAYASVAVLYNISPETTAIVDRNRLKSLDQDLDAFISNNITTHQSFDTNHEKEKRLSNKQYTTNVMTSIYNQVGLVSETCSNLVVVSLRPEIYVGFLPRVLEKLILKRNTRNRLLNSFYKKLANIIYGCTGKCTVFNDLLSPQCETAIKSLCKSVMLRTLQNVPPESVLFSQTDGALLRGGRYMNQNHYTTSVDIEPHPSCRQLEEIISTSINNIVLDLRNTTSSISIVPRIRVVNMCLLLDHNHHLLLYNDGQTVCKGQPQFQTSGCTLRLIDSLSSSISSYICDYLTSSNTLPHELNSFLDFCFDRIAMYDKECFVDWFVTLNIPTTNQRLFGENNQKALIGITLNSFTSDDRPNDLPNTTASRLGDTTWTPRFGDTVCIWPVLVHNNDRVFTQFRVFRPYYNTTVLPNRVFIMKPFLRYCVKLFAACYPKHDEEKLMAMFHAICKKYENETT